uniref:EGF-like domain-containing protein n=2 Tax=Macrostomum lignano TaxID=282301 RepID=A0A1I8GA25_9PLAT
MLRVQLHQADLLQVTLRVYLHRADLLQCASIERTCFIYITSGIDDSCANNSCNNVFTAKIVRPKVVVQKDYDEDMRDNNSPAAQNFWIAFVQFMLAVFRRSSNPAFANARHTLILISLGPGSVITEFDDKISGPQVDTIETEAISSDIESGISNLASSNESFSNFTIIGSFRRSTNANFKNAEFNLVFIAFKSGSVLVDYDLEFSVPDSAPIMSVDEIKAAMDSGLSATSSSTSNYTMDANTTATAYDYCATSPCSKYATCTNFASNSTFDCSCWNGFLDEDTSVKGTKCTEQCNSSQIYCSGNGVCRTNAYNRVGCQCFSGYTGDTCSTVSLTDPVLAIVIAVPILFVIIVVVIAVVVYIYRKQGRFKQAMIDSRSFADGAGYGEDGGADRFQPMPPSSAGSLKNSVHIPRARLAGPEFGNMYQQERQESGASIDGSMNFDQQPTPSFSYPYKRYSDSTFRSGGAGPSRAEEDGRQYF